jgi:4'-phosphopantetheinyl transferase
LNIILCTLAAGVTENPFDQIDPTLLSEAEHERSAQFAFPRDRWSYAAAHALLRLLLAEYHGLPPLSWRFRNNQFGRPEIDPKQGAEYLPLFSISHTHGMAVCALSIGDAPKNMDIGVDAESLKRPLEPLALADRFFSIREAQWLRALPEKQRCHAFIRLWTFKEAVAKATGLGLQMDLKSFHCNTDESSIAFDSEKWGSPAEWELHHCNVAPHHTVALALRRPPTTDVNLKIRHLKGKLCA